MTMLATVPARCWIPLFGEFMKKLFSVLALLTALILPCFPQAQIRLSTSDQSRFDSYYSRWQSYRQTNNQSQVRSMEGRMQDVYRHYGIPAGAPYGRVASSGHGSWAGSSDRNSDWNRDRDRDRDRDDDHDGHHDNGRHRGWDKDHRDHDKDHDRDKDHDKDHDHDHDR
jgi:hypothetical protein